MELSNFIQILYDLLYHIYQTINKGERNMSNLNSKNNNNILVLSSLLAALIFITTGYILHIPMGINGGYVHIGDAFIYLSAVILPTPYAMATAAVGARLADISTGSAIWAIPTIIIKPILVLFFKKGEKIVSKRNIIGSIFAGIIGTVLYMIAEGVIIGNFWSAFILSTIGMIQPIGSSIVFIILGFAFDKSSILHKYIYR